MRKQNNLKKLYIETVAFVLLFALLGAMLLAVQTGYRAAPDPEESDLLEEDAWYAVRNDRAGAVAVNAPRCLLLRNTLDPFSVRLSENLSYTLGSMNVNVSVEDVQVQDGTEGIPLPTGWAEGSGILPPTGNGTETSGTQDETAGSAVPEIDWEYFDDIVFCFPDLSVYEHEIGSIKTWLSGGGHLLIAGGLDEKLDLTKWADILGIVPSQEAGAVTANSLRFTTELLAGANGREFSDDVISGEVFGAVLTPDCTVHIETTDEAPVPLLWERKAEDGRVIVCNADLMEAKNDRGIVAAVYSRFYPVYAYPVINACVYCIDDCPSPIPAGYEKNVVTQYGYTVGDFYANVWMPAMQRLSEEYGIKYSVFAIQTYDDKTDGAFDDTDNRETAAYYASLILSMGGEVGIHGYNHQPLVLDGYRFDEENEGYKAWPNVMSMLNSVKAAIRYTDGLTDDVYVQAYVAPSNILSSEALTELLSQVEDLRVYAGVYTGTADQFLQEYEVLANGVVFCPRLTADMQMEDSEWWTQLNELNYHYIASNFIHPDDILDEQRSDGGDFEQMVAGYTQMIEWNQSMGLRDTTISGCGASVQRYCNLSYTQTYENDLMTLRIEGLIDEAFMMVRTSGKEIVSVEGGSVSEISEGVYILTVQAPTVTMKTVDRA